MGGSSVPGSLLTPDDPEETARLEQARVELARLEAESHGDVHTGQRTVGGAGEREKALSAGD
jgi:hypothetical protein